MGRENVEVIRDLFRALEDDDYVAALELFDPEVEWHPMEGTFRGLEGLRAAVLEWLEPWEDHRIEAESIADHGDGRVLAQVHLTARGRQSEMEVDQRFFQVYRLQDGRIRRMDEYVTLADAHAAIQRGTR